MDNAVMAASGTTSTPIYDELVAAMVPTGAQDAHAADGARGVVTGEVAVRLSEDAAWVAKLAEQEAQALAHGRVGTEHLLLGLMLAGGKVSQHLRAAGVELGALRRAVSHTATAGPLPSPADHGGPSFDDCSGPALSPTWTGAAGAVFAAARAAAARGGRHEAAPADLFAALASQQGATATLLGEPVRAA